MEKTGERKRKSSVSIPQRLFSYLPYQKLVKVQTLTDTKELMSRMKSILGLSDLVLKRGLQT